MDENDLILHRAKAMYERVKGLKLEIQQLDLAMAMGRLSVRVDFVTPDYVGPYDIQLNPATLPHIALLLRQQLLYEIEDIGFQLADLGFEP